VTQADEQTSLKLTPPQSSTGAAAVSATPLQKKPSGVNQFIEEKQKISLSKERRAARTLGIIMGVFVICWLPFFLMYVILPFCQSCCPTNKFKNFITWLGYINSGLNPVIYTIFNLDYRRSSSTWSCWSRSRGGPRSRTRSSTAKPGAVASRSPRPPASPTANSSSCPPEEAAVLAEDTPAVQSPTRRSARRAGATPRVAYR